jgi:transposase
MGQRELVLAGAGRRHCELDPSQPIGSRRVAVGWCASMSHVEFLLPYAPELNPVEYLWAHWKHHELANLCPKNFAGLSGGSHVGACFPLH